jgi:RNA polymerase sigma-70 factor (ECF subfamily)
VGALEHAANLEAVKTMISDEALMLDFQRGSRPAFEELFARYREPLYGFFRRRLQNPERAEELAQETFLAVIRGAARYEPRALVRTYLYGIALKLVAAERRKQQTSATTPLETEPAVDDASEAALWVRQALEKLDSGEREILMLREYEQLSYSEIADLLRLPVNTVRSRLFRSRMALKSHLEGKSQGAFAAGGAAGSTSGGDASPLQGEG